MARSEHLPIYKRSYDLCLYLEQVVAGFPRWLAPQYATRGLSAGVAAALVRARTEAGSWPTGPECLLVPHAPDGAALPRAGDISSRVH
jgi:hypothetical protein